MAVRRGVDGRWMCGRGGCRWPRGACPTHRPGVVGPNLLMPFRINDVLDDNGGDNACSLCGHLVCSCRGYTAPALKYPPPNRRNLPPGASVDWIPAPAPLPPGWRVAFEPNERTEFPCPAGYREFAHSTGALVWGPCGDGLFRARRANSGHAAANSSHASLVVAMAAALYPDVKL